MKKIIFVLAAALILGMGSLSAQNKFKAAQNKAGTTPAKTEKATTTTTTKATDTKGNAFGKTKATAKADTKASPKAAAKTDAKATAKTTTKAAPKATPKKAAAKPASLNTFNGVWANSYSDGIGGMVTDYLNLTFDESTGTATGEYKDENGDGRKVSGKLVGNSLVMTYDADGDEFATIRIINENTLKLEGFTGTFKRVQNMDAAPKVDIATPVSSAPVDPAYEEVKKYLEDN